MSLKSRSLISTAASSCRRLSTSKPRRPRVRLSGSIESEIACSSRSTKRGTISDAFEKSAFDDLHDAPVDDRRRVDELWAPPACVAGGALGDRNDRDLRADARAEIRREDRDDEIEHDRDVRSGAADVGDELEDDALDEERNKQSDDEADRAAGDFGRR